MTGSSRCSSSAKGPRAAGLCSAAVAGALLLAAVVPWPALSAAASPAQARYEARFADLLQRYTTAVDAKPGTRVDYGGLLREPDWPRLLEELAAVDPDTLESRDERLAFFINAYNILAIDLILQNHPVASIKDIGSFLRPVWKRSAGSIAGRDYSLHEIEHEILRPLGEPRIHAAIVCASISCPNLLREPYLPERLQEQLDASLRAWLRRPEKGMRLDRQARELWLSPIFDWFAEDFEAQGGVLAYLLPHLPDPDRRWLVANRPGVSLRYFDYDWRLNE